MKSEDILIKLLGVIVVGFLIVLTSPAIILYYFFQFGKKEGIDEDKRIN